jgi:glucose/arabinose dehydrogenase
MQIFHWNKIPTRTHIVPAFFIFLSGLVCTICLLPSCAFDKKNPVEENDSSKRISVLVQRVADSLVSPTAMAFPGNGDVWVTEQTGTIRVIKNGKLLAPPLLDLQTKLVKINKSYDERGLLGITLHPLFESNKKFYVFYSRPSSEEKSDHTGVVAEYTATSASGGIDPDSGRIVLTIEEPEGNHNGGCIQFGPDGYLYISFGDGGGQGDKHGEYGNGQNMESWLGKILRIDINTDKGYLIPKDNPFVGRKDVKPEIWALGFRNPYRFSFDKASGQLFAGDVGQDAWEEVDIVNKGANYGWRLMEGTHCYHPASGCNMKGITMPIAEYSHKVGISVIGGYMYQGNQLPLLKNKYLFADWTGVAFYLQEAGAIWQQGLVSLQNFPQYEKILGFGEDPSGELYILANADTGTENKKGTVFKIVNN